MAYKIAQAKNYLDLLDQLRIFLTSQNVAGAVTVGGSNVGNGTVDSIIVDDAADDQTWTLVATSSGATATFSVTGSVDGAQAAATTGTPYDNGIVSFTIVGGSINFAIGDTFSFTTAEGLGATEAWTQLAYETSEYNITDDGTDKQLILQGPGLSGSDEILIGIQTFHSTPGDYFNWRLSSFTGYSAGTTFDNQPGNPKITRSLSYPRMLLWNQAIPYWLVANGRRFILVAKISTVFEAIYGGFILPYATPSKCPYPVYIGGATTEDIRWSDTGAIHCNFISPGSGAGLIYTTTGWEALHNQTNYLMASINTIWPFSHSISDADRIWRQLTQNMDGSVPVFPTIMTITTNGVRVLGELHGAYAVPGYGVASEDTISLSGDTYIIFQQAFRTQTKNFWALKLE